MKYGKTRDIVFCGLFIALITLGTFIRIPIGNEPEHVKRLVGAPEEYEFTCFLAVGYAAENAHVCRQKEIRTADRIHRNVW